MGDSRDLPAPPAPCGLNPPGEDLAEQRRWGGVAQRKRRVRGQSWPCGRGALTPGHSHLMPCGQAILSASLALSPPCRICRSLSEEETEILFSNNHKHGSCLSANDVLGALHFIPLEKLVLLAKARGNNQNSAQGSSPFSETQEVARGRPSGNEVCPIKHYFCGVLCRPKLHILRSYFNINVSTYVT